MGTNTIVPYLDFTHCHPSNRDRMMVRVILYIDIVLLKEKSYGGGTPWGEF
jgi:hypothetical protein